MSLLQHNGKNSLEQELEPYGKYVAEENCLYLKDNKVLMSAYLLERLKALKIKIQLDLFT